MLYFDRIIIYPLLGPSSVSVYSVATFFGKSLGIVMLPIANVLLGYFSQKNASITKIKFLKMNSIFIFFAIVFFVISIFIAPVITNLLYPSIYLDSKPYILFANLAAIIGILSNMAQPAILKFAPIYCQIIKELIYGVVYFVCGIIFLNKGYGLYGFCYASIISNTVKLFTLYLFGIIYLKE